jgi:hypothetical protein
MQGETYVRARRKVVSQWLETQGGATLFLPVGRKMQLRWMQEMQAVSCSDFVAYE